MSIFKLMLIVIAAIIVDCYAARQFFKLAEDKGYHDRAYFWWMVFVPPVGYLMIIAMPDKSSERRSIVNKDLPEL